MIFSAKVLHCCKLICVFCVDEQPDPEILNYQLIYSTFEQTSNSTVDQFFIAKYIRETYTIPFTLTHMILKNYCNTDTGEIKEESFVELMKELNHTDILNIPHYIDIFKQYDLSKNYCIRSDTFSKIFFQMNESKFSRSTIRAVLRELKIKPNTLITFLDFLKIMSEFKDKKQKANH